MSQPDEKIRETVRKGYAQIAQGGSGCCGSSTPQKLATGIGYSSEELELLPEGANMGLSFRVVIRRLLRISSPARSFWTWAAAVGSTSL